MSDQANQWNAVAECRRLVFLKLESLPARTRSMLASTITSELRTAGLLGPVVEQHLSAADAASLLGRRCARWAVKHAAKGDFGQVFRDGGDWLIPASGLEAYLAAHAVESSTTIKKARRETGGIEGERVCKGENRGPGRAAGRTRTPTGRFTDRTDAGSEVTGRKAQQNGTSGNLGAESGQRMTDGDPDQADREGGGGGSRVAAGTPGPMGAGERGFCGKGLLCTGAITPQPTL